MQKMFREASEKQELLKRETALKEGFMQRLASGDTESARLKKELELSSQMYEGLKGQYDELEDKFSQLFEQFLEEQRKNAGERAAPAIPVATPPALPAIEKTEIMPLDPPAQP